MSLWAKWLLVTFVSLPVLFACEDPSEIGGDLLSDEVGILYTDTITVKSSTVLLDTVRTARLGNLLVGRYTDPVLGTVEANSYFQLVPYGNKYTKAATSVFDSLTFVMVYNYTYADTNKTQTINICRLKEVIDTLGTRDLVNNIALNYDPTPLAKITLRARSRYKDGKTFDTIRVRLPNSLGLQLFNAADQTETSSYPEFVKFFNGLALVPAATDNAAVIGFSTAYATNGYTVTRMDLHFHSSSDTTKKADYFPFSLDDVGQFNRIISNRKGTLVDKITNSLVALPSSSTQGQVFMQNGVGLVTKLEFPYLSKFRDAGKYGINKVEMILTPKSFLTQVNTPPPTAIYLAETDSGNKPLRNSSGIIKYVTSEGYPLEGTTIATDRQIASFSTTRGNYIFNLTSYVTGMLHGVKVNNGLLLMPTLNNNVNRLILNASEIKLKVYYTVPKS
ncbi:MAG: DUF4270 family protein [Spirosomataceae bacterium]